MRSLFYVFAFVVLLLLLLKKPAAAGAVKTSPGKTGGTAAERNNNPLNIRKSGTSWKGKVSPAPAGTDPRFEVFETWAHGVRAGIVNMRTWYGRGKNTIRSLVSTWAPPSDGNETGGYVAFVASGTGIAPDSPFIFNKETVRKIFKSMAHMEAGKPTVSDEDFDLGWSLSNMTA